MRAIPHSAAACAKLEYERTAELGEVLALMLKWKSSSSKNEVSTVRYQSAHHTRPKLATAATDTGVSRLSLAPFRL